MVAALEEEDEKTRKEQAEKYHELLAEPEALSWLLPRSSSSSSKFIYLFSTSYGIDDVQNEFPKISSAQPFCDGGVCNIMKRKDRIHLTLSGVPSKQSFGVSGDPAMSKSGALSFVTNVGGHMEKEEVKSAVEQYEKYHDLYGGNEETRKANVTDLVNKYYDLITSFCEYGWGESFHFAGRWKGETLRESIKRHEHFIALQLGLKRGMKVLDVGCGIGGPLREIARFSLTSITGLNNNEYQISRAKELNRLAGLSESCELVKASFMNMPFPDNTFDAVYAIEATSHAGDLAACYKEIYRVLKPGHCFAAYELCMTAHFDPRNENHQKIKADVLLGSGLPDLRTTSQCLEALKLAGFEVVWERDRVLDSPVPWYLPFGMSKFSISNFRLTAFGRCINRPMISILEFVGLAPVGSSRVASLLDKAAIAHAEAGRKEIFTPMYFFLARKPL